MSDPATIASVALALVATAGNVAVAVVQKAPKEALAAVKKDAADAIESLRGYVNDEIGKVTARLDRIVTSTGSHPAIDTAAIRESATLVARMSDLERRLNDIEDEMRSNARERLAEIVQTREMIAHLRTSLDGRRGR